MQSNQSKLLIAGLVAAQVTGNQIERPEDLVPQELTEGVKTLLAQIKDDDSTFQGITIIAPPGNANAMTDQDALESHLDTPTILNTENLDDKVDLVVSAAIGGLMAKKDYWVEKLQFYADERLTQFRQVDESCRVKTDAAAQRGIEILTEASEKAFTEYKQCRKDYIDKLLLRKEELQGDLQNILNETIIRIKELKVGQVLNESGLPTEEHATILKQKIEQEIEDFETAMTTYVDEEYTPTKEAEEINISNCNDAAEAAWNAAWIDTTPEPNIGVMPDVTNAYTECAEEMEAFRLKIQEVINDMRQGYVEEAQIQQHLAKTEFLQLVSAVIKKIHDISSLTEEEKEMLMSNLADKREAFGVSVMEYITAVTDETQTIVDDLSANMIAIEELFEDDVETNVSPVASLVNQVEDLKLDLDEDVEFKANNEESIKD